jgi:cytochrome P450
MHVLDLYPIFWAKGVEVVEGMTKSLQANSSDNEQSDVVDVHGWASRVTLDIIGVAGMGHDFGAVKDENSKLNRTYRTVFSIQPNQRALQALAVLIGPSLFGRLPTQRNRDVVAARTLIRGVCQELIDEKRIKLEKGIVEKDILSVAIESGGFNDEELIDQLMTFLAAGHETTASAMLWAVYHLCVHQDMQTRLREEVRANLPPPSSEKGSVITNEDIDNMPYLNAFCSEVLRITPSVPLTLRTAAHDTTIQGHPIPKGTSILAVPWAINTSTELWGPDAAEFNPNRWIDGPRAHSGGAESAYSFLTFLHGPRSCIGQKFAQAEFACLLAAWVGRFEMRNVEGEYKLEIGGGITSKPKNFKARMKVVDGW